MSRLLAVALAVLILALVGCGKPKPPPGPPLPGASIRLPDTAAPEAYAVRLTPDLEHMVFTGAVTIALDVRQPTRTLTLNALDLSIDRASVDGRPVKSVGLDAGAQTAVFDLGSVVQPGRHTLAVTYRGKIYTSSAGLFVLDYDTPEGKQRMLATQMEAADARRVLPCWDQPDRKATFQLTVVAPAVQMAVSNMPEASSRALPGGLKEVAFQPTPKMSSYLLFLGIGDMERISRKVDGVDVGVVVRRGSTAQAHWALDRASELLTYYDDYFGVRYPLPKLDLFAAPGAGSFGAMENWGAILFFEDTLLIDPRLSSEHDRQRVTVDVAHEMAHQWFGDLVTMAWWDDLWLNESFAEWMEAKAVDHLHPEWRIRLDESGGREAALQLDAGPATHPVVQPAETLDQVEETGDSITYDKGAAVIRMLEAYVGEEAWRSGVQAYLRRFAYASATHDDLWRAVESASTRPVAAIAQDFTEQSGVPLVNAEIMVGVEPGSGLLLVESQLGGPASAHGWRIPVTARPVGGGPAVQMTVRPGSLVHALRSPLAGPLVVNPGQVGYFRTVYSPSAVRPLLERLGVLDPADQLGLVQDSWALAQAGEAPAAQFMALVDRLPASADPRVWDQTLDALADLDSLYRGQPGQPGFRAWARRKLEPLMARAGWGPPSPSADRFAVLRPSLLAALDRFDDPAVRAEARRRYDRFMTDPESLNPGLRQAVLRIAGAHADAAVFESLRARAQSAHDPQAQRQLLIALSRARDPAIAVKALTLSLSPEVPPLISHVMIGTVAVEHPELAWRFALDHRDAVERTIDPALRRSFIPGLLRPSTDAARADELHAFAQKAYPEGARREAGRVEAEVRRRADVRSRRLPEIDRWLAAGPVSTRSKG